MGAPTAPTDTDWRNLPLERKVVLRDRLRERQVLRWEDVARLDQRPPAGEWGTWVLLGGRGAGKTRAVCEALRERVVSGRSGRSALVAPTAGDVRDVLVEGESGVMATAGPDRPIYEPSKRRLVWPNGALTTLYSADEPERLRGPQHDFAACDELRAWRYLDLTLDNLYFGLRLGADPRAVMATTPGGMRGLRDLLARPDVTVTYATTYANLGNLSPRFRDRVVERYEGTRVGRAELYGEMIEDVEGALFAQGWIDDTRVSEPGAWLQRIVVGVDPAEGSGGSEQAYTVCALGADHRLYVLESVAMRETVATFARRCIEATARHSAEMVVEKNHGGAWLREVLESECRALGVVVPIRMVVSSVGKRVRAEPVAALYEQRRVAHIGVHDALEDQLCVAADTLIATERGDVPIHAVRKGDRVWTRKGLRRVAWAGQTGIAEVGRIRAVSGESVRLTAGHPVLIADRGFVPARAVGLHDRVVVCGSAPSVEPGRKARAESVAVRARTASPVVCSQQSGDLSSSGQAFGGTWASTGIGRTRGRTRPVWSGCFTVPSGPPRTALSPRGSTCITLMATSGTGSSTTSSLSAAATTMRCIPRGALSFGAQRSGPRADNACGSGGVIGRCERRRVANAARATRPNVCAKRTTVRAVALTKSWAAEGGNEPEPVYNLTVEGEPEFFADGVLVHNCSYVGPGDPSDLLDSLVFSLADLSAGGFGPSQGGEAVAWNEGGSVAGGAVAWQ